MIRKPIVSTGGFAGFISLLTAVFASPIYGFV